MADPNRYKPPEAPLTTPGDAPSGSTEVELGLFVGANSTVYLRKWRSTLERGGGFAGFNWAAFLFSSLWFLYRKMYLAGILIWLVSGLAVGLFGPVLAPFAMALVCGFLANVLYYRRATRMIADVRRTEPESSRAAVLMKRGGTNTVAVFVALLASLMLMCAPLLLA